MSNIKKPIIIGIYGISGSGKTYLLNKLKEFLEKDYYAFFDGSDIISKFVDDLEEFKKLDDTTKYCLRQRAIDYIRDSCASQGRVGIVAGHLIF